MPNYKRNFVKGGSYFFTVVTQNRNKLFCSEITRKHLRNAINTCQERWPFEGVAWVLLDDHLHTVWTLPEGDDNYSRRWSFIKRKFTEAYLAENSHDEFRSTSKQNKRERGVWQRRFWEHTLRDKTDFQRHIDYIHYNPVKHGFVNHAKDYPFSTFHQYVRDGVYDENWGISEDIDLSTAKE